MKNDIILTQKQFYTAKNFLGDENFYGSQIKISNLLYVINEENHKNFIELADYLNNIENINLSDYVLMELQEKEDLFNRNIIYFLDYTIENSTFKKNDIKAIINKAITHLNTTSRADEENYRMEDFKALVKLNNNPEDFKYIFQFLKSINNLHELSYEETSLYRAYYLSLPDNIKKEQEDLFNSILPELEEWNFFKNTILIEYITTFNIAKIAHRYGLTSKETEDKLHEIHSAFLNVINSQLKSTSLIQFNLIDKEFITNVKDIDFKIKFKTQKEADEFSTVFNKALPILINRFNSNEKLTHDYCLKLLNSLHLKSTLDNVIPVINDKSKKQKI